MTKKIAWFFGVLTVVLLILGGRELMLQPDGKMHVVFFDVGQGDSALLTLSNGTRILIDGGPDWSTLEKLGNYMPFFDRTIDIVILSHPNSDHMTSFPEVLRRYSVGTLVTAGATYDSGMYAATLSGASVHGVPLVIMHAPQTLSLNGGVMEVLWPPKIMPTGFSDDANNASLVLRISHGEKRVLFTGDMESIVEKTLLAADVNLAADILKVPHHGSKSSSTLEFLKAVQPKVAVISAGKNNSYGHPHPDVLARLTAIGAKILRTDDVGDIELKW